MASIVLSAFVCALSAAVVFFVSVRAWQSIRLYKGNRVLSGKLRLFDSLTARTTLLSALIFANVFLAFIVYYNDFLNLNRLGESAVLEQVVRVEVEPVAPQSTPAAYQPKEQSYLGLAVLGLVILAGLMLLFFGLKEKLESLTGRTAALIACVTAAGVIFTALAPLLQPFFNGRAYEEFGAAAFGIVPGSDACIETCSTSSDGEEKSAPVADGPGKTAPFFFLGGGAVALPLPAAQPDERGTLVSAIYFKHEKRRLESSDEGQLKRLAAALKACDVPGQPLKLSVEGFASSADFRTAGGDRRPSSDADNLKLSNKRAVYVSKLFRKNGILSIEAHHWPTFEDMAEKRPFKDIADQDAVARDREKLNQVAMVFVKNAGACAL
ncbi:MAG: hypothetical protein AAGJ09_04470 [Pseudomonadota bacterium]